MKAFFSQDEPSLRSPMNELQTLQTQFRIRDASGRKNKRAAGNCLDISVILQSNIVVMSFVCGPTVLVMAILLRRGWWKPWNWSTRTWVLAIVVSVVMSPFVTRWICLWQVPDVELPFKTDDLIGVDVPAKEDAFTGYASVVQMLGRNPTIWLDDATDQATRSYDAKWDERLDQWLVDNANVLAEFERASQMERAQGVSLKGLNIYQLIPLHMELRKLARLSEAEALRCERSGDLEQAWRWHRATLRCSRHAEKPGFSVASGIGRAIRIQAYSAISRWAADPCLTVERLRLARTELSEGASHRMKASEILKIEYLMVRNTLNLSYAANTLYPKWEAAFPDESVQLLGKRLLLWTIGQPEVSMRLS